VALLAFGPAKTATNFSFSLEFELYHFWGLVSVGFYLAMADTLPSDSFVHKSVTTSI
jgi:hypothetical protein